MKRNNLFWKQVVTVAGVGYIPFAPGTAGALVALVPAIMILIYSGMPNTWLLLLVLVMTVAGIAGSNKLEKEWGKDPSRIVIDEAVGMWISLLWLDRGWITVVLAFILFRFFDIVKPMGIRTAEDLPGGIGVMADDILAGIYTNLVIQASIFIIYMIS